MARKSRKRIVAGSPAWIRRVFGRPVSYVDMVVADHGIFRLFYLNRHRLADGVWRSAQPAPHHVRRFARDGIRTVVNLRGEHNSGSYWLEEKACAENGITLVNYKVRSRAAPTPEELKGARDLFETVEYPMLMHCKSGADRAGLMSVLYRHLKHGEPMERAVRQLSIRYGHMSRADTGILDYVFQRYIEDNRQAPIAFFDWVDTRYDPDEIHATFRASGWANRLVNGVLKRE
jgi:uncharacterized protein (TIGR01244 family)